MRISDWSSDVCSSDLIPEKTTLRRIPDDDDIIGINRRVGIGALTDRGDVIQAGHPLIVDGAQDDDLLLLGKLRKALCRRNDAHQTHLDGDRLKSRTIGRQSYSERVCQYEYVWGVAVAFKK